MITTSKDSVIIWGIEGVRKGFQTGHSRITKIQTREAKNTDFLIEIQNILIKTQKLLKNVVDFHIFSLLDGQNIQLQLSQLPDVVERNLKHH